jgi:hypothetical protein
MNDELREFLFKLSLGLFQSLISALLAKVSPRRLYAGNSPSVNSIDIELDESQPFSSIHLMTLDGLDLDILKDSLTKGLDLLHKLCSQLS